MEWQSRENLKKPLLTTILKQTIFRMWGMKAASCVAHQIGTQARKNITSFF